MNFVVSRAELRAIAGIARTASFALQKTGQLRVLSRHAQQSWFDLAQVLACAAKLHGLPEPDAGSIEKYERLLLQARLAPPASRK